MPTNKENIKKALDNFEEENYVDSEEVLSKELKKAKNDYLKKELGVEEDPVEVEDDSEGSEDDNGEPDPDNQDDE